MKTLFDISQLDIDKLGLDFKPLIFLQLLIELLL